VCVLVRVRVSECERVSVRESVGVSECVRERSLADKVLFHLHGHVSSQNNGF
jgi:hypothetical protein